MVIKNKILFKQQILPKNSLDSAVLSKQKGVVLIVSLVFLVALTGVAAALMQNTTSDMKMTGASTEKLVATQAAISAIDEIIDTQRGAGANNLFTKGLKPMSTYKTADLLPTDTTTKAQASADVINNLTFDESPCPRARVASSTGVIECNVFQIQATRLYGKSNTSNVVVDATIAQQLLKN
ncbi:pilus assembly PilX family protein [Colwellia echini]|uniref:Type 4 fimbrial biogenesis protein PilX N-terminal domain-containing protein n=1 Tax=Colwellia echini TaxID=1982103 RepID=A0ABY3MVF1_9GAMM|nr:pilus assembly PilX N-terminal domain-containing protein [Colwellia echini]TYK65191.1 hypothetical protein CWS31_012035 [Colwellia echini]